MNKAEERAYEAYPKMSRISEPHGLIPADNKSHYLGDGNEEKREGFIAGYLQAEKDLELTCDDIEIIINAFLDYKIESVKSGKTKRYTDKEYYQEVLKRFKDFQERKKGKG